MKREIPIEHRFGVQETTRNVLTNPTLADCVSTDNVYHCEATLDVRLNKQAFSCPRRSTLSLYRLPVVVVVSVVAATAVMATASPVATTSADRSSGCLSGPASICRSLVGLRAICEVSRLARASTYHRRVSLIRPYNKFIKSGQVRSRVAGQRPTLAARSSEFD